MKNKMTSFEMENALNENGLNIKELIFLLKDIEELLTIINNDSQQYKNVASWTNVIYKKIRKNMCEEDFNEFVDMWL